MWFRSLDSAKLSSTSNSRKRRVRRGTALWGNNTLTITQRRPLVECLESRLVLSATMPALLDFSTLTIDPNSYDDSSVLVKFDTDALTASGYHNLAKGQEILPGASLDRDFSSLVPGLHQVNLTAGLDVSTALANLMELPWVAYAEPDFRVHTTVTTDDPRFDELWGLNNEGQTGGTVDADIDALGAWDVNTGSGNTILAVIDTGVDYNHPDLAANMWTNQAEANGLPGFDDDGNGFVDDVHGYDFFNHDGDPMDDNGHGTHVAGTIGAVGNNSLGVSGINWDIQIMALKFLGADGSGSGSDAIEALEYAVANGATISNNSWGGDPFSQTLLDAITAARDAGHLFVTAAGNGNAFGIGLDNDANPFYPAGYNVDNVLAVAATDHNDQLATFSNYGATTVDLAAPGVDILSTQPGGGYQVLSGTSMATPHVAGVAALLWDANPSWTYSQVIDQLLATVDPLPALAGLTVTGGRLNAASALGNPEPPPPPPPPAQLPYQEDFNDGIANSFRVQAGNWDASSGRFDVVPAADNDEAPTLAVLPVDPALPADLEIQTRINADEGHVELFGIVFSDFLTNAFVVFDYQDNSTFKFAGADMDNDQWVIGRYENQIWSIDASAAQTLNSATNYDIRVLIENDTEVSLQYGATTVVSHAYGDAVTDGDVGLGTRNSSSHFDNLVVQEYVPPLPPAPLPVQEDFEDDVAELFDVRLGTWTIQAGRYQGDASGSGDAVSTWRLQTPLPADLQIDTLMQAVQVGISQNGFIIFDYQSPTDFKYAGANVGTNKWSIGHRTASGWVDDQYVGGTISTGVDYQLQVTIQNSQDVTLSVDGIDMVSFTFGDNVTDGAIGIGTRSAVSQFDDVAVQEFVPPPPPPPVTLPVAEDFNDGVADLFTVQTGTWSVDAGRYVGSHVNGSDAISTLGLTGPLPTDLDIDTLFQAVPVGISKNGFIIFDYQSATDFKYAGANVGTNKWSIGHRTASGWVDDQYVGGTISTGIDYQLQVRIQNSQDVTLSVDGIDMVSFTFGDDVTDGAIGIGTRSAVSQFDDVAVQEFVPPPPPPPVTLPVVEDFNDGVADLFTVQTGTWSVDAGRYVGSHVNGSDAISTLGLTGPLPTDLDIDTLFQAAPVGISKNGFIIFDYQSATDFKYAGANVGTNKWSIGHRTASGWVDDQYVGGTINTATDYQLQVTIQNSQDVTLSVDGIDMVSFTFSDNVTDGAIGIGTRSAVSQFDDVAVQEFVPPPPPPPVTLPVVEDFNDGVADLFTVQAGTWSVDAGRYVGSHVNGSDAISTLGLTGPLPTDLDIDTLFQAVPVGISKNGFIIIDYQSATDFKYAGANVGTNKWSIGHRTASGWVDDQYVGGTISTGIDYQLQVTIQDSQGVTLSVDGIDMVSFIFGDDVTDGAIGIGTRSAVSQFDDVAVQALSGTTALAIEPSSPSLVLISVASSDGLDNSASSVRNTNAVEAIDLTDHFPLSELATLENSVSTALAHALHSPMANQSAREQAWADYQSLADDLAVDLLEDLALVER